MVRMVKILGLLVCGLVLGAGYGAMADDASAEPSAAAGQVTSVDPALQELQDFVGKWKGVGQVRRGSTQGAWIEQADWRWDFADGRGSILFTAPQSKHLVEGRIVVAPKANGSATAAPLTLVAKTASGAAIKYAGMRDADGAVTFTNDEVPEGAPNRVVLRFAAEKMRLVAALDRRIGTGDSFTRLAEVGYTRAGGGFGKDAGGGPVCIVTGGSAEIAVGYMGKTYYVCCTGCKDLFEETPAKFVAAYEAKLAEKKK